MTVSEALKKAKEGNESEEVLNTIISNNECVVKYIKHLFANNKKVPQIIWNDIIGMPKISLVYSKLCMENRQAIPVEIIDSILGNIVCTKTYIKLLAKNGYEISNNLLMHLYEEDDAFIPNFAKTLYCDGILDDYENVKCILLSDVELTRDFVFSLILSKQDISKEYIDKIKEDDQTTLELILELISLDIDIDSPICQVLINEFVEFNDADNCFAIANELLDKGQAVPYDIESVIIHDDDFIVDYCLKLKFENKEIPREAVEIMENDITLYNSFSNGLKKMINSVVSTGTSLIEKTPPVEEPQEEEKYIYGTIYCEKAKLNNFIKVIRNLGAFCGLDVTNPEIDFVMTREQLENIAKIDGFIKVTIEKS